MKKAIIRKDNEYNMYYIYCEKTGNLISAGITERDCKDKFFNMELPDYGLYKQININQHSQEVK